MDFEQEIKARDKIENGVAYKKDTSATVKNALKS